MQSVRITWVVTDIGENFMSTAHLEIYLLRKMVTCSIHILPAVCNRADLVKSSHLYLYSAFNNTNCVKATAQYQNGKIVSIM